MQTLKWTKKDHLGILTFFRPDALNAINSQMMDELTEFLRELKNDKSVRALILTGTGKAFIAGADIKEMNSFGCEEAKRFSEKGHQVLMTLQSLKIPVIAAVNGFALGGGCEMAMACDFIYASDSASFGLPEVTLGLIPGFGGTQRLPKFVGVARALEMILSGQKYSAIQAMEFGLVNSIFKSEDLLAEAEKMANLIAHRGPVAVALAKRTMMESYHLPLCDGLKVELEAFSHLFTTSDQKEGLSAFIEKRAAQFKGN
jgi:enoyl-CoA hydratase